MKSVLISIQPFWVFLIIAKKMGWDIPQKKTVEVRLSYPKSGEWNKKTIIYCSNNKQSFNRIPKQYQQAMLPLVGKVIGEFVCNHIENIVYDVNEYYGVSQNQTLLPYEMLDEYLNKNLGYGWHISDLKIYDQPKELSEFYKECNGICYDTRTQIRCKYWEGDYFCPSRLISITRPPMSWCYVEGKG